jgi:hypothetical protein
MTFKKGDPRINRKGRPKSFQKLRDLAKALGNEQAQAVKDGVKLPVIIEDINGKTHIASQVEMILREMMHTEPIKYLEIAYGKVPQPIEVTGEGGGAIVFVDETHRDTPSGTTPNTASGG